MGPVSKARRAAVTALSTSAASAAATLVITSPVAGLIVSNALPLAAACHSPLIRPEVMSQGQACSARLSGNAGEREMR